MPIQPSFFWLIARKREVAESFLLEVNRWNTEVHGEILVFEAGQWSKSEALFGSIRKATFDNLVLPLSLKCKLQRDIGQFFASEELYRIYGLPWKRGILLIGPPGNGKTHAVKAIINSLERPCLYVKSFDIPGYSNQAGVRQVFERARRNAPCVVLEDLDSLIDSANRSFFLNELDGFAAKTASSSSLPRTTRSGSTRLSSTALAALTASTTLNCPPSWSGWPS